MIMSRRNWKVLLELFAMLLAVSAARGVEQRPSTLDDLLLPDLGGEIANTFEAATSDVAPAEPDVLAPAVGGHKLLPLTRRMREAQSRIARADCGPETQATQQAILAGLDRLIVETQKRCGQCGSGPKPPAGAQRRQTSGQSCNKPGDKPGQCEGKAGDKPGGSGKAQAGHADSKSPDAPRVDMDEMKSTMKRLWGELPARQRQEMLQLPVEQFLPEYEQLIEDYFRRLSREKGDGSDSP